jgi:hypothetical protein
LRSFNVNADTGIPALFYRFAIRNLSASLFGRKITDNRKLEFLIVVGLDHQKNPAYKHGKPHDCKKQSEHAEHAQPTAGNKHADENLTPYHPEGEARHPEKNGLKSMEAYETVVFIRLQHQKNHTGNNAKDVAQHAGHIIGHTGACRNYCSARRNGRNTGLGYTGLRYRNAARWTKA